MELIILSDIHANFNALQSVIHDVKERKTQSYRFVFLGDLINYNDQLQKTIDLFHSEIHEKLTAIIKGNHEFAILDGLYLDRFSSERSRKTVDITNNLLTDNYRRYLVRLFVNHFNETFELNDGRTVLAVHGTYGDVWGDMTKDYDNEVYKNYDIVLHGHNHFQSMYTKKYKDGLFTTFLNPGSVGQPRNGDNGAQYLVIKDNSFEFRSVEYKIHENKLYEQYYTERLFKGI